MSNPDLFAATFSIETLTSMGGIVFVLLLALVGIVVFIARRYKRCPSNAILVIYGKVRGDHSATCVHGGGKFVLPIIQDYAFLGLEPIQIDIPLKGALSIENIRVNVPSTFTVAIGTDSALMQNAAIRLLGLNTAQIKKQSEDIIFGQLRQVIASMQIEDINRDREIFLRNIQTSLEPELRKIGLVLINVNITDITDESGYIEAIGRKAASEAIQKARGDVAEEVKQGEIRVAEAERDKMVQVAEADKVQQIGIRTATREQAVRVAELDKEQQVGEQRAAFGREMEVADADREKRVAVAEANATAITGEADADRSRRIAVADANATAVTGETESQARIAAANATLKVKQAEAYQLGETKKRVAEAAVLESQNRAMAKAALAEAEKIEAERRAAVEAPAKAQKAKVIVDAQAEAEKRRLEAEGQAAAIFAQLEAEAKGQYEILARKGRGLREIIDACGGAEQAFQLMMLEHLDTLAETAATAISNIKFDKVIVWENGGQNGQTATGNFLQGLSRTMPPMLQVMKDIGGIEVPDYVARLAPELSNGEPAAQNDGADNDKEPVAASTPAADPIAASVSDTPELSPPPDTPDTPPQS